MLSGEDCAVPPQRDKSSVVLGFGEVPGATALHLEKPLASMASLLRVGPGREERPDNCSGEQKSFLWVESGNPWLPSSEWILGLPWAAWMIDTHVRLRWHLALGGAFEHVFCAQRDAVGAFESRGVSASWLPLAAPRELCGPGLPLADRRNEVAFVGNVPRNGRRERILRALQREYDVVGLGEGYIPPERMMCIYRSARVVVNIPLRRDLNMRTFEAAGARSVIVGGPQDGIEEVLPKDSYVEVNRDEPEAWLAAVRWALHGEGAQARADLAFEAVLGAHTYHHRAEEILAQLGRLDGRMKTERERYGGLAAGLAHYAMGREVRRLRGIPKLERAQRYAEALAWGYARAGVGVLRRRLHVLAMDR